MGRGKPAEVLLKRPQRGNFLLSNEGPLIRAPTTVPWQGSAPLAALMRRMDE